MEKEGGRGRLKVGSKGGDRWGRRIGEKGGRKAVRNEGNGSEERDKDKRKVD